LIAKEGEQATLACGEETDNCTGLRWGNKWELCQLEDLVLDVRVILKWIRDK